MTLSAFADELDHIAAEFAALAVCNAVISHPDTTPKDAGRIWLLQRFIAYGTTDTISRARYTSAGEQR